MTQRYVVLPHKDLRNACSSLQGDVQLTSACQMFGISSAIEGVQQISILSSIAEQWVRFIAGRRPANLSIWIVPDPWTDSKIAYKCLRSALEVTYNH